MSIRSHTHTHRAVASVVVLLVIAALIAVFVLVRRPVASVHAVQSPNAVSSTLLVEHPGRYDGTTVTFEGEAIGEAQVRAGGAYAWIHLNDDAYARRSLDVSHALSGYNSGMAVYVRPAASVRAITRFGGYRTDGDRVVATGVFHAACPEHGGDMDIHATQVRVVAHGRTVRHPMTRWKVVLAAALLLVAAAFGAVLRYRARQERAGDFPLQER